MKSVGGDEDVGNDFETGKLEGLQEYGGESRFWIACTAILLLGTNNDVIKRLDGLSRRSICGRFEIA